MKLRKCRKLVSILVTLSMLLVLLVPLAAPAGAYSVNRVSKVVTLSDDFIGPAGVNLTIKEDSDFPDDFVEGEVFQLILCDGVNWLSIGDYAADPTLGFNEDPNAGPGDRTVVGDAYAVKISDQILELTFSEANPEEVTVPMWIEVDGASDDLTVEVKAMDSGVSGGTYVFARISDKATKAEALSVKTIGDPGWGGDIRIEEASMGSLGSDAQYIKLKLPTRFKWNMTEGGTIDPDAQVIFSGGFSGMFSLDETADTLAKTADGEYNVIVDGNTLWIYFNPTAATTVTRGMITVKTPINPDKDASYGDIEVDISGSVADDHDVLVAKYADYGVNVTVDSLEEIKAGKFAQELDTITIEETVSGTLIPNRDITLVFPEWVKITDASVSYTGFSTVTVGEIDGTDNEIDLSVGNATSGTTKGKIKIDLEISVEGNKSGDIEMTVEGGKAGIPEDTKLVVGNAIALVEATADASKDVKIGVQAQEIGTITITELVKEAISEDPNGSIAGKVTLTLPEGVWFSAKPKVEVTEGNLDVDSDNITLGATAGTVDAVLNIPIDGDSTKPSTITITGAKVTVDRTVPTGDLMLKVGGGAIIENQKANKGWIEGGEPTSSSIGGVGGDGTVDQGEFDTGTAVKIKVGNIITPAPGEVSGTSVFTIGSTTYTVNGVEKTMDVAPYIKGDRTYMPIRFVAQAAGVAENNIIWNAADQSVVLIKGDRVVKLVIGSNQLLVNGIALTMDAAPEIVDPGRTMLPLRAVTQALGCVVDWDAATQTVTVSS